MTSNEPRLIDADLVLLRLSWLLRAERWPTRPHDYRGDLLEWHRTLFWIWIEFFQNHDLTSRTLAKSAADIGPNFSIKAGDLTDEGMTMYNVVEQKWYAQLGRRDQKAQIEFVKRRDVSLLMKYLKRLRDSDDGPSFVVRRLVEGDKA